MTTSKNRYNPDYRIPPGWLLKEHLEVRGISPAEFAEKCARPTELIEGIIAGKAPLDEATALQFEKFLGLKAYIWLGIESKYRSHRSRPEQATKQSG